MMFCNARTELIEIYTIRRHKYQLKTLNHVARNLPPTHIFGPNHGHPFLNSTKIKLSFRSTNHLLFPFFQLCLWVIEISPLVPKFLASPFRPSSSSSILSPFPSSPPPSSKWFCFLFYQDFHYFFIFLQENINIIS